MLLERPGRGGNAYPVVPGCAFMRAPVLAVVLALVAAGPAGGVATPPPAADVVCILPGCLEWVVLGAAGTVLGEANDVLRLACAVHRLPCQLASDLPRCAVPVVIRGEFGCLGLGVPVPGGNHSATSARYLTGLPRDVPVPGGCPPTWFEDPAEEPFGLWGACWLLPPSKPDFRITVTDELGKPVAFRWFASPAPASSCDWGAGVGTVVAHLRPWCLDVTIGVLVDAPALPGRIVLTAA